MKKIKHVSIGLTAFMMLVGCGKTDFSGLAQGQVVQDVPSDIPQDPVVVPVGPAPTAKLSSGACKTDSSTQVLSCLKCDVPQVVGKPQLGVKAQALHDIMVLACNVSNKSDLNNFRPTEAMILNKLNRASESAYPDSTRTSQMTLVIQGLTNPNDGSLRQKMFGGLWYQPPYSDAFETYFGITVQEAKSTFCWDGDKMTGTITGVSGLMSKQYMDCQSSDNWLNCKEIPSYVAAYGYRSQLQAALKLGVTNPYSAPVPDPQKTCVWDKFEGNDTIAALKQLKAWKSEGRKVSMNIVNASGVGSCSDANESAITSGVSVQLGSFVCK